MTKHTFKVGDKVRFKGAPEVGTIVAILHSMITVEYDHGDRKSHGWYAPEAIETPATTSKEPPKGGTPNGDKAEPAKK